MPMFFVSVPDWLSQLSREVFVFKLDFVYGRDFYSFLG